MGTRLPFAIETVFLVLVLPVACAYLLSLAGITGLCLRTAWRRLICRLRRMHRRSITSGH